MGKTYINIAVNKKFHDDIALMKIKTNARSLQAVLHEAYKLLKEKIKNDRT